MSIRKRIKGETPSFFKKVYRIGALMVAIGASLAVPALGVPMVVSAVLAAGGGAAMGVAKLVVKNPNDLN